MIKLPKTPTLLCLQTLWDPDTWNEKLHIFCSVTLQYSERWWFVPLPFSNQRELYMWLMLNQMVTYLFFFTPGVLVCVCIHGFIWVVYPGQHWPMLSCEPGNNCELYHLQEQLPLKMIFVFWDRCGARIVFSDRPTTHAACFIRILGLWWPVCWSRTQKRISKC